MFETRVPMLAEAWMPLDDVGAECMREKALGKNTFPPHVRLHVWWARRPLTVSRAAILGSVLPQWRGDWSSDLLSIFPGDEKYRQWALRLLGILGHPAEGRKLIDWANQRGITLKDDPYRGHKRAFTLNPDPADLAILGQLLEHAWGTARLRVADPMAGGGSIPFEALRYGFDTCANELNPVASVILQATLEFPRVFGTSFRHGIRKWGDQLARRCEEKLLPFFPGIQGESIHAYIWARTVACPVTGKPVPLSPNWWLRKGRHPVAVRVLATDQDYACRFEILEDDAAVRSDPDQGTVSRGVGVSPWTRDSIDGDYIKAEAQAGRMGQQLYAIAVKRARQLYFRAPSEGELKAVAAAEEELQRRLPAWEAGGIVPTEERYIGPADRSANYGITRWHECFAPRQLLSLCTYVEELRRLEPEIVQELGEGKAAAVVTYLGLAIDKAADYNSRITKWDGTRNKITNTFDRHDFSFKWSHGEFDAASSLLQWTVGQVEDAYAGIAQLATGEDASDEAERPAKLLLAQGNAADLASIDDESISCICVDPPYGANVMYAECSDFFYVWQKRTVGHLYPEWFRSELTNKDEEAVENVARFAGMRKRKELAAADYERKLAASFREMHRVLHPNGVLTVMFTHKEVETWNKLAIALIDAGFSIQTSWPVHTESEHSLHQAKKNAAKSTILLVCRKRTSADGETWWDDIKGEVRETARAKAREFHGLGISGVDLYISAFGPVLSVLSSHWPVLSSETDEAGHPLPLQPDVALDLAREEVIALRKAELLHGRAVQFDPVTDWYVMAWDAFRAEQFRGDEARKLALVLGLSLEHDLVRARRVITKKSADVVIQLPRARRRNHAFDPDADSFDCWLDAVHAAMLVYEEDGARACEAFLGRTGLRSNATFALVVQALLHAIPRTKKKDQFVRPEAHLLDELRLSFFPDLEVPAGPDLSVEEIGLWEEGEEPDNGDENGETEEDEDDDDDEE
jgi:putative DNA methylase